jgi:rubredoxin
MTIRCPACDVVYRLPPGAADGQPLTFRCSRCDHVFAANIPPAPPLPVAATAPDEIEDDDETATAPDAEEAERPVRERRWAARFALRILVAVPLLFGLLSIYVYQHRDRVTALLERIPLVGSRLAVTRLEPGHVQLIDVRGEYARAGGDALVFVITGSAVNNAPVPLGAIRIKGSIVGSAEQHRAVYAGAAPHDVHDLSTHEIELLQTLEPPRDWRLLPGEDGAFLVAFVDPPVPLKEFRVEVAEVHRRKPPPIGP